MKKLTKISAVMNLLFTSVVMANTVNLNLTMGAAYSQLSNRSTVTPVDGLTKSYKATQSTQSNVFMEGGLEYVFNHLTPMPFALGLGLSGYYVDLGHISGTEIPGVNIGLTDPLYYKMQASSAGILFEPRFAYTAYYLQPYILVGAGYAWNTLNHFVETTPAGSNAPPSNPYGSHTEGNFAYELGAGIQYPIMQKQNKGLILHLGYRYLNLGDAQLGSSLGQTTNSRLASKNISSNVIDVGLSYQY